MTHLGTSLTTKPDIFEHGSYRAFLCAYVERRKAQRSTWSKSRWAKDLGFSSPATVSMILNGDRHPGRRAAERFVRYFKFDERRGRYFHGLVQLEKSAKNPVLHTLLAETLRGDFPKQSSCILDNRSFSCIANWHYLTIREMTRLKNFRSDPHWISENLNSHVAPHEVRRAIKTLLELGLVTKSGNTVKYQTGTVETTQDLSDEAIKSHHEQMIDLAKKALRNISNESREISGTTFTTREDRLPLLKEKLRQFQDEILSEFEIENGDVTLQLNLQLFPLTRSSKERNHEV